MLYIPVDEHVVQEPKEANRKTFKSTMSAELDLGDENDWKRSKMKEGKSKFWFRWERARWSRSIVEKLRARMDEFVIDCVQGKQSEVVNKHICGSTGELAEDWRDVTKVLGSVGREVPCC